MAKGDAGGAKAAKKSGLNDDLLIEFYRRMMLGRRFEERVGVAYTKRKFSGFCHLHIGQEALAVGVQAALKPTDYMISGYRSHTQAMGKGIEPQVVLAELFGKVTGCSRGKGGSMHMFSNEKRFFGGHGIVGGQVPLAAGIGFSIRYENRDDICICYVGDAATNQGQFFEALNMMATWKLPVIVIIENNKYGMGTDYHRVTSVEKLAVRADAFNMASSDVDGMNVIKVYEHVTAVFDEVRKTKAPHLLEAMTYRYRGHSVSDPGNYRTKEELTHFQDLDPIKQHSKFLIDSKIVTAAQLEKIEEDVKAQINAAEEFADNSPEPELEEIWKHVFA